jgi:arylsulfatase A-like enzyme
VVFILVDDLGYSDIGAFNPTTFYETPHVDRLAEEGVRFTDGYAASPVCSPTRFSIMTGKYPARAGATQWFSSGQDRSATYLPAQYRNFMAPAEITLAEAFRDAGFRNRCQFRPGLRSFVANS